MAKTWTTARIKALKGESPFACLTAYDYTMARLIDAAEIPMILVGDSLAMTMQGHATTLPVSMAAYPLAPLAGSPQPSRRS